MVKPLMRMSNYTLKKGAHAYNVHLVYKKQSNQKQNLKQQVKKLKLMLTSN